MDIKKRLMEIATDDKTSIKSYVAKTILSDMKSYDGSPKEQAKAWYNDLQNGGCSSGMVGGLIYYTDTHKFYNDYADEIDALLDDYAGYTGEEIKIQGANRRNFYAWFGFEEITRQIVEEDLKIS